MKGRQRLGCRRGRGLHPCRHRSRRVRLDLHPESPRDLRQDRLHPWCFRGRPPSRQARTGHFVDARPSVKGVVSEAEKSASARLARFFASGVDT
ncbi:hypothetical protein A176_002216 [Myxococcus hansupus]|uniref:Uncharacterized protein n=1 Tax=Pseudomyxococcus hansupus TaxID=1297742 RepID=A0A0H4WR92_9BACT|nr:hypothetical protein A176_002216 [Myxococcus hansupus]